MILLREFVLNTCSTSSNLKNPRVDSFKIAAHFRKQKTEKRENCSHDFLNKNILLLFYIGFCSFSTTKT